ncbi:hypothetical protein [Modestobacter excelsi]|uniref:hypothetical protein n=1 Tax=Modestobacter excelsi TaxID=2213161 RepID=UPI00110CC328|nr:hypothetical protein [Modestobacter excelsi]
MDSWFKIQEPGDPEPWALVYWGPDHHIRRYVEGQGLIYWPMMIWFLGFGGDLGGKPITLTEAKQLVDAGIGRLPPGQRLPDSQGVAAILMPT